MPDKALQAYLARNYLDGAKAVAVLARAGEGIGDKKKRKKKRNEGGQESNNDAGLRLLDDDGDVNWKQHRDSDEEAIVVVDGDGESSRKKSKWNRLGSSALNENAEQEEVEEADERPQMAGQDGLGLDDSTQAAVEDELLRQGHQTEEIIAEKKPSIKAGLKTKEEMRAERLERERLAALQPSSSRKTLKSNAEEQEEQQRKREREERAQETVYRDASGRKIDTLRDDEEKRRIKEEKRRREREKQDWNKGQVQLDRIKATKRREEEEKHTDFARYSNDQQMNQDLRHVQRAADPALGFLTKKQITKGPQKPMYKGSFPPNRFKIRPGYRWDGVERSNGFENKYFQKKHERVRRQEDMDAWGKEDL